MTRVQFCDLTPAEQDSCVIEAAFGAAGLRFGLWWPGGSMQPAVFFGDGLGMTRHGYRWAARARWDREGEVAGWMVEDEAADWLGGRKTPIRAKATEIGATVLRLLLRHEGREAADGDAETVQRTIVAALESRREVEQREALIGRIKSGVCFMLAGIEDAWLEEILLESFGRYATAVIDRKFKETGGERLVAIKPVSATEARRLMQVWGPLSWTVGAPIALDFIANGMAKGGPAR